MRNPFIIKLVSEDPIGAVPVFTKALDFLYNFAAEGSLTDAINPAMRQTVNMEMYLTGSSDDSLIFTVVKTPPPFKK